MKNNIKTNEKFILFRKNYIFWILAIVINAIAAYYFIETNTIGYDRFIDNKIFSEMLSESSNCNKNDNGYKVICHKEKTTVTRNKDNIIYILTLDSGYYEISYRIPNDDINFIKVDMPGK